jgi:hypothetical protein
MKRQVERVAVRLGFAVLAGMVVAAVAAAEEPAASKAAIAVAATAPGGGSSGAGSDQFFVQERPLSALVSGDLVGADRRFAGGLGYGVTLTPQSDPGAGQISLNNWHFGLDVLQPSSGFGRGTSITQFAMNYGGQVSESLALNFGPTMSFGGDSAASAMAGQGGLSGLRRLQADSGVRDYGVRGSAVYSLTNNWALTGVLGYRRSVGELGVSAADEHFFSVLGMGFRF